MRTLHQRISTSAFFLCSLLPLGHAFAQGSPPQITNTGSATINYQEGDAPAELLGSAIIEDSDSPNMLMATIELKGNYQSEQDTLLVNENDNIKAYFDDSSGTLRLLSLNANGGVSLGQMQSVLRTLQFALTSGNISNRELSVTITVTDAEGNQSSTVSRSLKVAAVNDAPIISSTNTSPVPIVDNESKVFGDISISDADDNRLSKVEIEVSEGFQRTEDRLKFEANSRGLQLSISDDNDMITLSGNANFNVYQNVILGFVFEHKTFFLRASGRRRVDMRVYDAQGEVSNTLSRYFIVQPAFGAKINLPPHLEAFTIETSENSGYNFDEDDFEDYYNDLNGDDMRGIIIRTLPENGTLSLGSNEINNEFIINRTLITPDQINQLNYTPASGFSGSDSFSWNARDDDDFAVNDEKITVRVSPVNQAPVLNLPSTADAEEDEATPIPGITLTDADQDELTVDVSVEDGVLFLAPKAIEEGWIKFIGTKNGERVLLFNAPDELAAFALSGLIYQPDDGFNGTDELEVKVKDSQGEEVGGKTTINVLLTNDAPVLKLGSDEAEKVIAYTENNAAVKVTETLTIDDEEGDQILSATISISRGFVKGEDMLSVSSQNNGIESSYNSESGTLNLSGEASAQAYQTLIRTITYVNSSENPKDTERALSFTVTDNGSPNASSQPVNRIISVTAVNDAPVLSGLEEAPISYDILDNKPVPVTNGINIVDVDNGNLQEAVIAFTESAYQKGKDVLSFKNNDKIKGNWNANSGVLTLSGSASLADYQAAIKSVTYKFEGEEDELGNDSKQLSIRVSDGDDNSNTLSRPIIVITNDAPIASDFSKTTNEDESLSFSADEFPYEDPDNFPEEGLQGIAITALPQFGVLLLDGDSISTADVESSSEGVPVSAEQIATLQYVPNSNYNGEDTISWAAFDGAEYSESSALITINISAQADAPVPSDIALSIQEDQTYTFKAQQFSEAAPDPDGDALSGIIIRQAPANGVLQFNGINLPANSSLGIQEVNNLKYVPNENYNGEDSFSWTATDGTLTSEQTAVVAITIEAVNDAPIVNSFTRAISDEATAYNFAAEDYTKNYLDIENTPLSFIQITSLPQTGTLLLNGTAIAVGTQINAENIADLQYQVADEQSVGFASFGWNASDGSSLAAKAAQVTIIVGVGVTDFSISTREDTEYVFASTDFSSSYGNPDGALSKIRIESLPQNGTLTLNDEAVNVEQEISTQDIPKLKYVPAENYFGEDSLSWNGSDGSEYAPESAQVFINIAAVNDVPTIAEINNITLLAGQSSQPISLVLSDLESPADSLTIMVTSSNEDVIPQENINLSGSGENRSLVVTALADTQAEVIISITVNDGEATAQQTFSVMVVPYLISLEIAESIDVCNDSEESIALNIEGGNGPYQLVSECDQEDCSLELINGTISLNPTVSTTYYLTVVDANNVSSNTDTLSVNVRECSNLELEIPTAFTPDGDQVNDFWQIGNIQYATNVVVEIFDRYGKQVYRSEGYRQPWDGTYENSPAAVGTYYYFINIEGGLQSYKGSVTILR
ncbi:tandem-95 repeat protein [Porifericola rhodea]|uniref:tandem-95 repeat protein n=1 Tax=Porifericola rhodea TaxID=930972 RepID=UPI002666FCFA|nr:tandem-95 repeat protein [Porifericola rhodea]WKN29866.1 tandem-95 repeat protein [Porifericola rhodea]